ncbi:MAG: leucine-rich repeat protein [Rikenellaceae bacterium]|jgi:hypothetical protein|nr:leucine-rich repeat protein [Rikenellaceae bacterium]
MNPIDKFIGICGVAALCAVFSACKETPVDNNQAQKPPQGNFTITAGFDEEQDASSGVNSRMTLTGSTPQWESGVDHIGLFSSGTYNALFTAAASGTSVNFNGSFSWGGITTRNFYAYFPYKDGPTSSTTVPFSLSPVQKQVGAGSSAHVGGNTPLDFLIATPVSVTFGSPVSLNFKHVFSLLELKVKGSGSLSKIVLSGAEGDVLAFSAGTIDVAQPAPVGNADYTFTTTGNSNTVTLDITPAVTLTGAEQSFFMMINPASGKDAGFQHKFTFTVDGSPVVVLKPGLDFKRNKKFSVQVDLGTDKLIEVAVNGSTTTLESALTTALSGTGLTAATVKNLKITGTLIGPKTGSLPTMPLSGAAPNYDYIKNSLNSLQNLDLSGCNDTELPVNAFTGSTDGLPASLTSVILPNTLLEINSNAFYRSPNLTSVFPLPGSLQTIYEGAFNGCEKLEGDIALQNYPNLKSIGKQAFKDCVRLTGQLNLTHVTDKLGVAAFVGCRGLKGTLTLPTIINGSATNNTQSHTPGYASGANTVPDQVFLGCSGLTLPPGGLVIPSNVEYIGSSAFEGCLGFSGGLTLPAGLKEINFKAFYGTTTQGIDLNGTLNLRNVQLIDMQAFQKTNFSGTLTIPSSTTAIFNFAFSQCQGFTSLNIANAAALQHIGTGAFDGCINLTGQLVLPTGLEVISGLSFQYCDKLSGKLTIPASVKKIGPQAFTGLTQLTELEILSNQLTEFGFQCFMGCSGLGTAGPQSKIVNIPASINLLETAIFMGCSNLEEIKVNWTGTSIPNYMVYVLPATLQRLRVPAGSTAGYESKGWSTANPDLNFPTSCVIVE